MKKLYIILLTVVLMLTMAISAGAEDLSEPVTDAVTEAAETPTEAVGTTAKEVAAESESAEETSPIEADSELGVLLEGATPEQIETIKQYIEYGVSKMPLPDQVRLFVDRHLESIAWIFAGICFVIFYIKNRSSNKKLSAEATVMTNNAVEIAEKAEEAFEAAKNVIALNQKNMSEILRKYEEKMKEAIENANAAAKDVAEIAREGLEESKRAILELSGKESGLTEAEKLMAQLLTDLVEVSALPEWKRDEFKTHLADGIARIEEVTRIEEEDQQN